MALTCDDCGQSIRARGTGWYREVRGWTQQRSAGGANAIRMAKATGHYLCKWCMDLRQMHGARQLEMFPEAEADAEQ